MPDLAPDDWDRILLGQECGAVVDLLTNNRCAGRCFPLFLSPEVSMIDIRELNWQANPSDAFGATAMVQAGDRRLRIDAGFRPYFVQDTEPMPGSGIINALRGGRDLKHMDAQAVPLDAEGNVFVNYAINSGHNPAVALNLESVEAVNAQLAGLAAKAADTSARIYGAASARRMEAQSRAEEMRTRAAALDC